MLGEKKEKLDIGIIAVTLPNCLYQALHKKKTLKISPDYFRIRKTIDRRLYEIARKHCDHQREFTIAIEKLHLKMGSTASLKMFRHNIKKPIQTNDLHDYRLCYYAKANMVIFNNRNLTPEQEEKEQQREKVKKKLYNLKNLLSAKRVGK
ncbi:replication initiator protein A [Candidatus Williamhamiltonella defendens]|uniref:replication initiator protein A n=1 Tax=Candidatus Williamhamiltonella defendens TaxID=138072 RepID=UPI002A4E2B09|nr:replication initiator protein A [Candidatus Hamiltonella defensa]